MQLLDERPIEQGNSSVQVNRQMESSRACGDSILDLRFGGGTDMKIEALVLSSLVHEAIHMVQTIDGSRIA